MNQPTNNNPTKREQLLKALREAEDLRSLMTDVSDFQPESQEQPEDPQHFVFHY